MSHEQRPLEVVAAVIERDGMLLACRRAPGKSAAGLWEFPGGKVEPGESQSDALAREIREELGVEITVFAHLTTNDTLVDGRVIRLVCLRARLAEAAPTASIDHDALEWMQPSELHGRDWATPDLPAVHLLAGSAAPGTH
ncbi:(deoxy)nucleoside triphosphate pyrophosphohydrolase (plasmid) [Coraliomargarita sp. W4R53]